MNPLAAQKRRVQKTQFFQDLDKLDQYMHDDSDDTVHTSEVQQPSFALHEPSRPKKRTETFNIRRPRTAYRPPSTETSANNRVNERDLVSTKGKEGGPASSGAKNIQRTYLFLHPEPEFGPLFDKDTSYIIVDDKLDLKEALKDLRTSADVSKTPMVRMRWLVDCFRDHTVHDMRSSLFRVRGMKDPFCILDNEDVQAVAPAPKDAKSAMVMCAFNRPKLERPMTQDDFAQAIDFVQKVGLLDYQQFVDGESASEEVQPGRIGKKPESAECFNSRLQDFLCKEKNDGSSTNPNLQTMYILQQLAIYYERVGDKWRNLGYRKAVTALRYQQTPVRTKQDALLIRGIGESIADKIEEISTTGHLRKLEMAKADPHEQCLIIFMGIYGAGLKQARRWLSQGHRTLEGLLYNAELTPNQKIGVEHYEHFQARIPREEVRRHAAIVGEVLSSVDPGLQVIIGGSYRRGKADCGDIDLLITKADASLDHIRKLMTQFAIPELKKRGFLKAELSVSQSHDNGSKWHGASVLPNSSAWRRLDMLYVPWDERGAAMIYFTGNDIFNRSVRLLASWRGMRLNQHGLYENVMRGRGRTKITEGKVLEGKDEKKIFELLGVPWRPPEHRNL
ncbi:hypothetical protein DV736_g973, partial [Chaetothyriales sp. CBS 134916]